MKWFALIFVLCNGCAVYHTQQADVSYDPVTQKPVRSITTAVTATTFLNAHSEIAKSRTTQTDKTQSSSVGALNQSATNNVIEALHEINGILEKLPR